MRKLYIQLAGLAVAVLLAPSAWAGPGDGLAGSAHDFTRLNSEVGLCTFCHTPHKAQSQALLWNHALSTNNFSWTDTVTTAGTDYPSFAGDTYKGPTVKCLSCHDGSVAVGDVGWWNGGGPVSLLNLKLTGALQIGTATGDLTGNHPVAMPIPWSNSPSTYNTVTTGAGITLPDWKADPQTLGIVLYNDDGAGNISRGAVAGQTGIECGSCHDVHNGPNVQDAWLLYGLLGGNTDEYICLKCHTK